MFHYVPRDNLIDHGWLFDWLESLKLMIKNLELNTSQTEHILNNVQYVVKGFMVDHRAPSHANDMLGNV